MAHASYLDFFTPKEREKFLDFITSRENHFNDVVKEATSRAFYQWRDIANEIKRMKQEEESRKKVLDVLRSSVRGQRSTMEKEILRRFVVNHLSCIPKSISFSEMDKLCNELDWYPHIGKSIIFLQGDFGNVYYMIAAGRVGLYLEPNKDREMVIAREFGSYRGQPYEGDEEDLKGLGNNILTLTSGTGFGEFAILATTNKIRSCAAVSLDPDSFLLIMHAETYNTVLRQHHYRQKQLSSATALLTELPLFKEHNYSKIASIAYTMKSQSYSSGVTVARFGEVINNVMLIASGQVKVFATAASTSEESSSKSYKLIAKRIPKLAVAMLGRGQIIGEIEVTKGSRTFQMDYETSAAMTEILEMPATVFRDSISSMEIRKSLAYKSIEDINEEKEQRRVGRLTRAYDAVKKMMEGNTSEKKVKEELTGILPKILDPTLHDFSEGGSSKSRKLSVLQSHLLDQGPGSAVHVTRKPSFAVKNPEDLDRVYNSPTSAKHTIASAPSPASIKSSAAGRSPRKLMFSK